MDRFEIRDALRQYIAEGGLVTKSDLRKRGLTYANINRSIASENYFVTAYEELVATNASARLWFNKMVKQEHIMSFLQVQNKKGFKTKYEVDIACQTGELIKFVDFGKALPLYID